MHLCDTIPDTLLLLLCIYLFCSDVVIFVMVVVYILYLWQHTFMINSCRKTSKWKNGSRSGVHRRFLSRKWFKYLHTKLLYLATIQQRTVNISRCNGLQFCIHWKSSSCSSNCNILSPTPKNVSSANLFCTQHYG